MSEPIPTTYLVVDEWPDLPVQRFGPPEFVNFPGSFAEYVIRELEGE